MRKIQYILLLLLALSSCGTANKIKKLAEQNVNAEISLPNENEGDLAYDDSYVNADTLTVTDLQGNRVNFMKAIQDDDGQMVATAELQAAVVVSRFRNIAERNGEVDIAFDISIPSSLQDPSWQLRFYPILYILEDTTRLEELHITGQEYRAAQLKGYEQYNRFINSIITDPNDLREKKKLEIFIERNIPSVFKFKNDSTEVDAEHIKGMWGVTLAQAQEYYTNKILRSINNRKKKNINKKYHKYIKSPFIEDNIRLDSVITNLDDKVYTYIQAITTRNKLRKVELVLEGGIFKDGKQLYNIPRTKPLTFYISSVSAFTQPITRYVQKVIYRKAEANTYAYIDFRKGSYQIIDTLHENSSEIARIKENITELLENKEYDLDSVVITASSSPEGSIRINTLLSNNRAGAIQSHFESFTDDYKKAKEEQKKKEEAITFNLDIEEGDLEGIAKEEVLDIDFITKAVPEDWDKLKKLIKHDTIITDKESIYKLFDIKNLDSREYALSKTPHYRYMREHLYPQLRTVQFQFYLHRKGMLKDTINTTEIDTIYQAGITALRERDYKNAIEILRPYQDINTAVAYLSLGYDKSALNILTNIKEKTAQVEYMLALVFSRDKNTKEAVEHLIRSIQMDRAMLFRGNLDPEISVLIKKYKIDTFDQEEEIPLDF